MSKYIKWVAAWGNAVSITDHRPETYAKNLSLRYPIYIPFDGDSIRLTLDNYCGTEDVPVTAVSVLAGGKFYDLTFSGNKTVAIPAGKSITSDELMVDVQRDDEIAVTIYLGDYALMRSSVVAMGPLSSGVYAVGDMTHVEDIPIEVSRRTDVFYFLSNVSVRTAENNRAIVCYGDSITAQDWPDYMKLALKEAGISNVSVIRRATSGSRILREYDNITYESYGLKGTNRFNHEVPTDGADTVIIQQGINDIIHPVGVEVNPFRPMSDLPTVDEMIEGYSWYIEQARALGYKVYVGTLLPIEGWRTYAPFREELRQQFNNWLRASAPVDGLIDFDAAVRKRNHIEAFGADYDSGDHLHPSAAGYKRMAEEAMKILE